MKYSYYTLDVFTDRPFGGNPLAVFPHAEGMAADEMQKIARELNISETLFVGASIEPGVFPVRIFTPACELPFAGHPTVGAAYLLAHLQMFEGDAAVLEEGVGRVPVTVDRASAHASFQVAQLPEITASGLTGAEIAGLLGLGQADVKRDAFIASCGLPFQMLELVDRDAVDRAVLDMGMWKQRFPQPEFSDLYLFAHDGAGHVYTRMFSPAFGIPEDPATGSAAAALSGALAPELSSEGKVELKIEQGVLMGRPSLISAEALVYDGRVSDLRIAGTSVLMSEGRFLL